jgi:hypothetical protein
MLKLFAREEASILDEPIDKVLSRMDTIEAYSEEYTVLLAQLERLVRLQNDEKSNRVSPDTKAVIFGNLLGILIIVGYEHGHVIGSRALNFILRTKHQ